MMRSKSAQLLEKITRIIPGIAGYQDREKRRSTDKAVRDKAADEVARCRSLVSEAMNDLSRSGGFRNLRIIGNLERMTTKLERTEDELRFAPSGYAGWFDSVGVTLETLERLYEYDIGLLSAAQVLSDYIGDVNLLGTEDDWTADFEEALKNLQDAFEGRKKIMEGWEDNGE